ncbi:hypothetical protein MTR67_051870 [Solanum verrucosum]|uniref:Uncharacterized protein n=1 Tax=Solanum verrucosum TaxID=315347 RepID=A0AAF0V5Y2_SOLVR|nr:hypothetical protein MTR67_051870 [Solanum verrucosum]
MHVLQGEWSWNKLKMTTMVVSFRVLAGRNSQKLGLDSSLGVPVNYGLKPHSDKSATCEVAGLELKKKQNSKTISTGQELRRGKNFSVGEDTQMTNTSGNMSLAVIEESKMNCYIEDHNQVLQLESVDGGEIWEVEDAKPILVRQQEASGTREGILVVWDRRVWSGEALQIGIHTLTCRFEGQLQDFDCHITGVNAPNWDNERREEVSSAEYFNLRSTVEELEGGISHLPLLDPSMRAAPLAPSEWRKRLEAVNNTNNSSHGNFNPSFILLDGSHQTLYYKSCCQNNGMHSGWKEAVLLTWSLEVVLCCHNSHREEEKRCDVLQIVTGNRCPVPRVVIRNSCSVTIRVFGNKRVRL